jgi:hypothetical protein
MLPAASAPKQIHNGVYCILRGIYLSGLTRPQRIAVTPTGQLRFGFAGPGLWAELDARRASAAMKGIVPINPFLAAEIKFFGQGRLTGTASCCRSAATTPWP